MASRVTIRADHTKAFATAVSAAASRALNRAISTVRTDVTRKLAKELGLAQTPIRERLEIQSASPKRLEATLVVSSKPVPLIEYAARQTKPGVTYRGPQGRRLLRGSFIARMRSGHVGVFKRRTRKRLPIFERVGAPLPLVALKAKILESALAIGEAEFQKRLTHELGRALGEGG
jgi:hypothetical protein